MNFVCPGELSPAEIAAAKQRARIDKILGFVAPAVGALICLALYLIWN